MDADVARPTVPKILGLGTERGLMDILLDDDLDLADVLIKTSSVLTQTLELQFLDFDVQGVTKVTVTWEDGEDFAMDDITYIPE